MSYKYIEFDESGKLKTRYDSEFHKSIPKKAVKVDDDFFWKTIDEQDGIWMLTNEGDIVKKPFPEPTIEELITKKRDEINRRFNHEMRKIKHGVPLDEIASWDKQESEARAYISDKDSETFLLDSIAESRGISKADLAARIIIKADLFAKISGKAIGTRQALEDQLDALPSNATKSDTDKISWGQS